MTNATCNPFISVEVSPAAPDVFVPAAVVRLFSVFCGLFAFAELQAHRESSAAVAGVKAPRATSHVPAERRRPPRSLSECCTTTGKCASIERSRGTLALPHAVRAVGWGG